MIGIVPKSNAKLAYGDACFVSRDDGRFAVFVWLCPQGKSRSYFYGAICKPVVQIDDINSLPSGLEIDDQALIYIKLYSEFNLKIVGNVAKILPEYLLETVTNRISDFGVGTKHRVCGINAVIKWANTIVK